MHPLLYSTIYGTIYNMYTAWFYHIGLVSTTSKINIVLIDGIFIMKYWLPLAPDLSDRSTKILVTCPVFSRLIREKAV